MLRTDTRNNVIECDLILRASGSMFNMFLKMNNIHVSVLMQQHVTILLVCDIIDLRIDAKV